MMTSMPVTVFILVNVSWHDWDISMLYQCGFVCYVDSLQAWHSDLLGPGFLSVSHSMLCHGLW